MNLQEDIPQLEFSPADNASIGEKVRWSIDIGLGSPNDHTREQAAAILDSSDEMLNANDILQLEYRMETDMDAIVQFRIAYALYRCGDRTQEVEEKLNEALDSAAANTELRKLIQGVYRPVR